MKSGFRGLQVRCRLRKPLYFCMSKAAPISRRILRARFGIWNKLSCPSGSGDHRNPEISAAILRIKRIKIAHMMGLISLDFLVKNLRMTQVITPNMMPFAIE